MHLALDKPTFIDDKSKDLVPRIDPTHIESVVITLT